MNPLSTRLISLLMSFILSLGAFANLWPNRPMELYKDIDLSKFVMTFNDEFNGNKLKDKWTLHGGNGNKTIVRRGSYWNRKMAQVHDGNLHIVTKYLPKGVNPGDKAGWYTAGIDTSKSFSQKYGYFETRCILPEGAGLWSAFWLYTPKMATEQAANDGIVGAEIDVFESPYYTQKKNNVVSSNIHIGGYGENHSSAGGRDCYIEGNPYKEYNTYGVEWNESGYNFYINGKFWRHSNYGEASQVKEYPILSVEIGGKNAKPADDWAGNINNNKDGKKFTSDFVVDYVRIYQYK